MLVKAATTKDLSSYSFGNIALSNVANVIHSVYIFQLPPGPVWALHAFHLVSTGLMVLWYLRYSCARVVLLHGPGDFAGAAATAYACQQQLV